MCTTNRPVAVLAMFTARTKLLDELAHSDHVAFRGGLLSSDGWKLKFKVQQELMKTPRA
jgi:hypothetical protein